MTTVTVPSPVLYTQVGDGAIRSSEGRALIPGTTTHVLVESIMRRAAATARATGASSFVAIEQVHGVLVEATWKRADDDLADDDEQERATTFNLDMVVEELHRAGIPAHVDQTGGGCATIYAGGKHVTIDGSDERIDWDVAAGPGHYGWDRPSTALLEEFYVGPNDDGVSETTGLPDEVATASEAINWAVAAIAQAVRATERRSYAEWNKRPCMHCGTTVRPAEAGSWVDVTHGDGCDDSPSKTHRVYGSL